MKKPTSVIILAVIVCVIAVMVIQGIRFYNKKQLQNIVDDIRAYAREGKTNHLMVTYDPAWIFKHEELNSILEANNIHYTYYIKYKIVKSKEDPSIKNLDDKIVELYKKSRPQPLRLFN
ncbi:MAG: hypothetical protein PHO00_08680 [bacterium]|nr:hypothetical protein [bacterium]